MATKIEATCPRTLAAADLTPRGRVFPSPVNWRDQILYQLLPDRFSDGGEEQRPMFDGRAPEQFKAQNKAAWMAAGNTFNGGTLRGIQSKLDYLQNLGVTAIWINPPWKQRVDLQTYHGYGIQNFLDVDPRFGTRQDLRDLVDAAHDRGMYVILDVIYNHSGSNWFYRDENGNPQETMPFRHSPPYEVHGWRSARGESIPVPETIDDAVFPEEFQNLGWYNRAGMIARWEAASWEDPMNPQVEFRQGDFFELRDFDLERNDAIEALAKAYQYWIALSDCDGFRVDAVKHVSPSTSRKFCDAIHGYAQSIGKDNFLLVGELTDDTMVGGYLDVFRRNLDAILDIIVASNSLPAVVKGLAHPGDFFGLYDESTLPGSYRQLGTFHVQVLDDHDMSSRPRKERFAAHSDRLPHRYEQVAHAVGMMLTMPGIPSIYYGTEQAFDGGQDYHDYAIEPERAFIDRYIRECMFGGKFGAFGTAGCHFFNPQHPTYLRIATIARIRNRQDTIGKTVRRGHHYLRETSYCDRPFAIPPAGEAIAWSQVLYMTEVLMVLNTHGAEPRGAMVTVDSALHPVGSSMTVLYRSDWSDEQLQDPPLTETVSVVDSQGRSAVRVDLSPSGMAILS
ncbi:MAG: alpha-amylase family glycosyl hydrolase [Synechococcus sp.]